MAALRLKPRILYLVTEDWYFWSHRLPTARAARDAGAEVVVASRVRDHGDRIRGEGFNLLPLDMKRGSHNPFVDMGALRKLIAIYRNIKPDLVHHVAMKPVIYGSIAARATRIPRVVNAITGLGYVFSSRDARTRYLKPIVRMALRNLMNRSGSLAIVQNPDDQRLLIDELGVSFASAVLIKGSGVNPDRFVPREEPLGTPRATMVSRMIWEKGVGEVADAARLLREQGVGVRMVLVGAPDSESPAAVPEERFAAWEEEGILEWWGHRSDVSQVWQESHLAVLPSYYGEGIPKSLLEAAACGRPIVTTDTPGCREVVRHGENGLLVPPRNPRALADAIRSLVRDSELRKRMGMKGRSRVIHEFSEQTVVRQTFDVYRSLLGSEWVA